MCHTVFTVKTLVFLLSWDKCQFVPVQRKKILGLEVASKNCRMFVPADKKLYIKEVTGGLLFAGQYTNRQLASVAVLLMSKSAAANMAPLYIRRLYQSMGEDVESIAEDAGLAL